MRATLLLLLLGCATGAAHYGTVSFKPVSNAAFPPVAYSVGPSRMTASDADLSDDGKCIRGAWGRIPIDFCRTDDGKSPAQRWSGGSGEFMVVPDEGRLNVNGYFILDTGRRVSMDQYVSFGEGPAWDELRRRPGLLALAQTLADLKAAGFRH